MKAPWPYKLFLLGVFAVLYCFFYVIPNYWPLFPPRHFDPLPFENAMPFLPWTMVFYTSDYFFLGFVIVLLAERLEFHCFVRQMIWALALGGSFFWLYPTGILRPDYPEMPHPLVAWMVDNVRRIDAPTNCFPSMHVAFTGVGLWNLRRLSPRLWSVFFLWASLIGVSVLTTKQHYFWDIPGGIGVAIAAIWLDRLSYSWPPTGRWLRAWEKTPWWTWSFP